MVPWSKLLALVEPVYPNTDNGRQPVGLVIMLRTSFLQHWFWLVCLRHRRSVLCRSQAQEHNQCPRESQSRACFSHPETCLRIYKGSLPWHLTKSPVAVLGLRAGEPLPAPQPTGPAKGVVPPEAEKRPHRDEKSKQQPALSNQKLPHYQEIICARIAAAKSRTCAEVP